MTILIGDGKTIDIKEWQKIYNVKSPKISTFFSIGEPCINDDTRVSSKLLVLLDRVRQIKGVPVKLNSLYRTQEHQRELISQGYRAAKTSPHCEGMAADIDTVSKQDTTHTVNIIKQAANELSMTVRIGYLQYMQDGNTFVHVDVCPEYYAKDKPFHKLKHPIQWESGMVW